ncbi:MAG: thiamine pyrophosphate-dependent enzyme [Chloroflexota bacterium]
MDEIAPPETPGPAIATARDRNRESEAALAPELEPQPDEPEEPAQGPEPDEPEEPAQGPEPDEPALGSEPDEPDQPDEPAAPAPEPPQPITVGRMVANALRKAGVRWAFTVPGESFLGLIDGLTAVGIHVVATRHEGAAAFMAEAHAQLTGRPAACLATRAVGAANLSIGIHTAYADSSPMFALVGQVERSARGREGFQEVDLVRTVGGLAKWSSEPRDTEEAVVSVTRAVEQATTGRPGPVVLALAEDLLDAVVPDGLGPEPARISPRRPDDDEVGAVLRLLANAERPVILAGGGILRARTSNDLVHLAELLRVPVIAAWRRGDVIPNDHPLYLGMTGYGAPTVVRERLAEADAMLVIGCRLGEIASYGWSIPSATTRWAHVDIAPIRPSRELPSATWAIESDAKQFLRAAVTRLESRGVLDAVSADARVVRNQADRAAWEAATVIDAHPWTGPGIHPGRIVTTLREALPEDAIVTTDAGSFGGWVARGFRFRRPGTFLGPTSGAMGYGLPAAIAAGLVHRDRAVVAVVGDGGLGMTVAELETAVRHGLRTIVLCFDNEQYGMIRTYQDRREDGSTAATDLGPVDWAAVARGFGARGVRVETDAAFLPALQQALVADRPTVVHLVMDRRWTGVDARP